MVRCKTTRNKHVNNNEIQHGGHTCNSNDPCFALIGKDLALQGSNRKMEDKQVPRVLYIVFFISTGCIFS